MSDLYVTLSAGDRKKIRKSLQRGDIARIAARLPYSYDHVSRVLRGVYENREVWQTAADFIKARKIRVA